MFWKWVLLLSSGKNGGGGGTDRLGSLPLTPPPFLPENESRTHFQNIVILVF